MKPSVDCTVDEAVHPTSVSVALPSLKRQCEDESCLGGSKLNPAFLGVEWIAGFTFSFRRME
jgi:hypothetical protein